MDLTTKVLRAREAGAVKRLHTIPWIGEYTIAQHVYGMLTLLDILYTGKNKETLANRIMYHDAHERYTGDVPNGLRHIDSTYTRFFKEIQQQVDDKLGFIKEDLTYTQLAWFKTLDRLEFLLSCYDQRALGNKNIEPCIKYEERWFSTSVLVPSEVRKFVADFEWERTSNEL